MVIILKFTNSMTGFEDFEAARKRLTRRQAKSAMNRAMSQSMTPIVKSAKSNVKARFDTSESYKSIKKTVSKGRINRLLSRVGLPVDVREEMGSDAQVGMVYLEEGKKGTRAFALRLWENGFVRFGRHFAPRPWFRPAVDGSATQFLKTFAEKLKTIIEREAAKR